MHSNLEKYKKDLADLISRGELLLLALQHEHYPEEVERLYVEAGKKDQFGKLKSAMPSFAGGYQDWYSEAQSLIKQLLPDRFADFIGHYEKPKNRKAITFENYVIEDCLQGLQVTRGWEKTKVVGADAAIPQFQQQLNILKSVNKRFESSLFDIKQLVKADLFDSELDAARELLKNGFSRAAGAVSGVVLEKHLAQVCDNHSIKIAKRAPAISDLNELLKTNGTIEIAQWRFIQHLGDLRNLCDHNKAKEPTPAEVRDLIDGVEKVTKTIF